MTAAPPLLRELGTDLLRLSAWERLWTVALPFLWAGVYFAVAFAGCWPLAFFATMALSFVTFGSTSHDLVHRTLGLPRRLNDTLLMVIELLALRSGRAYRLAHLHHHATYPGRDDVEGAAAHGSWLGAVLVGPLFCVRVWWWAVRNHPRHRPRLLAEAAGCLLFAGGGLGLYLAGITPVVLVYVVLMVLGSWLFPLITARIPHDPSGNGPLFRTRVFRGVVASVLALEHLYHLEHHLYPKVPHRRWRLLAKRLDPYLERAGVRKIKLGF